MPGPSGRVVGVSPCTFTIAAAEWGRSGSSTYVFDGCPRTYAPTPITSPIPIAQSRIRRASEFGPGIPEP